MKVSDIKNLIKQELSTGLGTTVYVSDTELLAMINDGYKDITAKAFCDEVIDNILTESGIDRYKWSGHKITKVVLDEMVAPVCTLSLNPDTLLQYNDPIGHPEAFPVVISWTVSADATYAAIDNGIGEVSLPSGSMTIYPEHMTLYTLTATSDEGVGTATALIIAVELVYLEETPDSLLIGEPVINIGSHYVPAPSMSALAEWIPEDFMPQTVTLTNNSNSPVVVYYTKDGVDPTNLSALYSTPFDIENTDWQTTGWDKIDVKAIAYDPVTGDYSVITSDIVYKLKSGIVSTDPWEVIAMDDSLLQVGEPIIQTGTYWAVVLVQPDYEDLTLQVGEPIIQAGTYWAVVLVQPDYEDLTLQVGEPIITTGRYWDASIDPP
jgi:hypothetical protein